MSQVNIDKLNLFASQTVASACGRQGGGDTAEEFNGLLERASKTTSESASDAPSAKTPASASENRGGGRAESAEPAETEQAAAQPVETQESHDETDASEMAETEASETAEAEATEAEDDSKLMKSAATDDDSDDAKEDDSELAAENAIIVEIIGATVDDSVKTSTDTIAAQAELVADDGDTEAEADAKPAKKAMQTDVKQTATQLDVDAEEPVSSDNVQPEVGENAAAAKPNRNADSEAEPGVKAVVDEQVSVADKQPSKHGAGDRETSSRDLPSRKSGTADATPAPAEPEMVEAVVDTDAPVVSHRDAKKEADAGRDRPAAAGDPTVEAAQPRSDVSPTADNHSKADAVKPASGIATRSTAAQGQNMLQTGQVDRVQFVQRVVRAFEAASARGGNLRVRLHPPELGSLQLEMKVQNGVMTARLHAESTAARNLLMDNLPVLRDRLAQHDIKIQQFEVDLGLGSSGGSPHGPDDQQRWHESPGQSQTRTSGTENNHGETAMTQAVGRIVSDSSLFDVTI